MCFSTQKLILFTWEDLNYKCTRFALIKADYSCLELYKFSFYTKRWDIATVEFWIMFDVLEITVLFFFYNFIPTVGSAFLCFGWIFISLGEPFLIWVPQTWSGSLWCQKRDSSAMAQWKAGPLWPGGQCAQIHPRRQTIPCGHDYALICPST